MAVKVTRKGKGFVELTKKLIELKSKQVRVGFFENAKYPDGTPVAYVATIQEYGADNTPPRSFFRPTIQQQRNAWLESLNKGVSAFLNDRIELVNMLSAFGEGVTGDIRFTISRITEPPLAEATLKARQRKKKTPGVSAKPLIDTGYMLDSVNFVVEDK